MHQLSPAAAAFVTYWPVLAILIPLVLGACGHICTGIGHVLASTPWTAARGIGHTFLLVGGLLTGLYGHWGDIAKTIGEFVSKLSSLLPKGPGGGAAVVTLSLLLLVGCPSAPKLPPKEQADLGIRGADIACHLYLGQSKDRDPRLDELCTRLLAPNECDDAPDAGAPEGQARGSIAPELDGGTQ